VQLWAAADQEELVTEVQATWFVTVLQCMHLTSQVCSEISCVAHRSVWGIVDPLSALHMVILMMISNA